MLRMTRNRLVAAKQPPSWEDGKRWDFQPFDHDINEDRENATFLLLYRTQVHTVRDGTTSAALFPSTTFEEGCFFPPGVGVATYRQTLIYETGELGVFLVYWYCEGFHTRALSDDDVQPRLPGGCMEGLVVSEKRACGHSPVSL